jgi:ABC-type multidrug transport system fused ATPase/permease subunit
MNANATPDSPVHSAARTAADEPAWIEIGSPKRRSTPPSWSDETTHDAWDAADDVPQDSDAAAQDAARDPGTVPPHAPVEAESPSLQGLRLRRAPSTAGQRPFRRPAARDSAPGDGESPGEPAEHREEEAATAPVPVAASTGPADAWVQGPLAAADEPAGTTEPLDLLGEPSVDATEQLTLREELTAELEDPAEPAPTGAEDPESGDRWQVVADDDQAQPADHEVETATTPAAAPAAALPTALPTAADLAAATSSAGPSHPARPRAPRTVDAPAERPTPGTERPASGTDNPAPGTESPAPAAAPERADAAPDTERPAPEAAQQGDRPVSATLGGALDLLGPHLQVHRPALIVGLVALVLSIWTLVALPFPLKYAIDAALAVAGAPPTAPDGIGSEPAVALWGAAGALAGLVALQAGFRTLSTSTLERAGGRVATDLRGRLLSHLHRLSPGRDIDDLVARTAAPLVTDVARLRDLIARTGPRLLAGLLALASMLGVMLVVEPIAAAIVLLTAGLHALAAQGALRGHRRRETAAAADEAVLAEAADELLAATRTIQSYGLEQRAEHTLGELGTRAAHSRSAARRSRAVGRFLTELIAGLGVGAALLVGGWRMTSGTMTPGELIMVIAYVLLAVLLVREVVDHAAALPGTRAAAGRVGELLEHRAAITEPQRSQPVDRLRGEVVFSALSATGARGTLFDRISLVIPAGQHVALVGREGVEASALLSYLLRFDQPDTGRVLLDRFDTRSLTLADLRRQLAVVQRESALFTETVRENIRVGRPGASDDEIVEAARRSGADEFITLLPEGYDTRLTGRGAGLSDGQRRRLAITRALLRDAPVVVLDGADEDLAPTERDEVRRALEVLLEGRTALIRSLEPETVRAADRVVCFESGDLAEDGAPDRLAEDPDSWLTTWLHAMDVPTR